MARHEAFPNILLLTRGRASGTDPAAENRYKFPTFFWSSLSTSYAIAVLYTPSPFDQPYMSLNPAQNYAVTPSKMPDKTIPNSGAVKLQTPILQTVFPFH